MPDQTEEIRREAADWLIWLREDPSDAELRARFNAWHEHPANASAWRRMGETFDLLESVRQPATARAVQRKPRRRVVAAGMALAASALLSLLAPTLRQQLLADYTTGTADIRTIQLAEGTQVQLGPDTAISVAPGGRAVRLLNGQAWFDVRHDAAHPFQVQAGSLTATDIGTRFDVRMTNQATRIAVGEGQVRVADNAHANGETRDLRPGDWLRVTGSAPFESGTEAPSMVGLWRERKLQLRGATINEAVAFIRPWYAGRIVLADAGLGQMRVTGLYDLSDPAAALLAVVSAHGGDVHRLTRWILIVSGR